MKIGITLLAIINMFFSVCAYAVPTPQIQIQHWKMKSGANVFFIAAPEIPMVDVRVIFAAGSAYDGEHWGIANLTNVLLNQGTTLLSANQIADQMDQAGAMITRNIDQDMAIVTLRSLTNLKYLQPALKVLHSVITQPTFSNSAIERMKMRQMAEIKVGQQTPDVIASEALYHVLYQSQPYGHSPLGTIDSLKSITASEIKNFYHRYYVSRNTNVVVVGAVSITQAHEIANTILDGLAPGKIAPKLKEVNKTSKAIIQHIHYPSQQTAIMLGQVGINRYNPNYIALKVGNAILGALPMNSILFNQVRTQRGLAYYVISFFNPLEYRGPFMINLKTRNAKVSEAITVVRKSLDNFISHGPTIAQLRAAKKNILGQFPLGLSTNESLLQNVTNIAFYDLPLNFLNTYPNKVNALSTNEIKKAFAQTVKPRAMVTITVGPSE